MSVHLGSICSFVNGGTPSKSVPSYWDGEIPWITSADIDGPVVTEARSCVSKLGIAESATNLVKAGTVLLVTRTGVGKVSIAGMDLCFSQDITALLPDPSRLDSKYLIHFLGTCGPIFDQYARGATIKGITRDVVEGLKIPLPSITEQRRIAAILDQAEAMPAMRRAALAKLDTLAQSIFIEMFGDTVKNPKNWPISTLGPLILDGPQNGLYKPSDLYGNGTPILRIDGFYAGTVTNLATLKRLRISPQEIETYRLRANDIVVNRVNSPEYLGKCALIPELPEPTVFESNMMRFSVDETRLHPRYLTSALQGASIRAQILGRAKHAINQSSINQKDVAGFIIQLPPIRHQRQFADRMTCIDKQTGLQRLQLNRFEVLSASLQHRAFRGEL